MTQFKGTKGKWVVTLESDNRTVVNGDHEVDISIDVWHWNEDIEGKANALLISKAPEMLEMLEELIITLKHYGEVEKLQEVRNLIKEATEI